MKTLASIGRHGIAVAALTIAALTLALYINLAFAKDVGQVPENVPDNVRAWFKSVHSRNGVPCCDIADGHRTTWRAGKNGGYEVPTPGTSPGEDVWIPVPPEAIIYNVGNPVGEAVVWYVRQGEGVYFIRCFVPGGGV